MSNYTTVRGKGSIQGSPLKAFSGLPNTTASRDRVLVMHVVTSQVKEIGMNRRLVLSVIASAPLLSAQTKVVDSRKSAWCVGLDLLGRNRHRDRRGYVSIRQERSWADHLRCERTHVWADHEPGSLEKWQPSWRQLGVGEQIDGRGGDRGSSGGCISYFGRYDIDEAKTIVTHHVMGDVRPTGVGNDRTRSVEFLADGRVLLQ